MFGPLLIWVVHLNMHGGTYAPLLRMLLFLFFFDLYLLFYVRYRYEARLEVVPKIAATWTTEQKTAIAKACPKACFNLKTMEIEDHTACTC